MISPSRPQTSQKRSVTALISAKGGIGVTSVALDWARSLGSQNESCLLLELAGGDLAWMIDAAPERFTEDVARGRCIAGEAALKIASNVDALVSGNDWAIDGPDRPADTERLLDTLAAGQWKHWLIDCGRVRVAQHTSLLSLSDHIAVMITDDLACVSRTYTLVRRLTALGQGDKIGLILNRLAGSDQARSLTTRFNQLTQQFLGRTWPVIGVVPDGPPDARRKAVNSWTAIARPGAHTQTIEPAPVADNTGNPGVKPHADQF